MGLEKIGEIRKSKKITIEELSKLSGVPISTIKKISAGITTNPNLETVQALARALDCSLDDFDNVKNNKENYNFFLFKDEKEHIKKYRRLDDHGKEAANSIIDVELKRIEALAQLEEDEDEEDDNILEIDFSALKASAGNGYMLFDDDTETKTVLYNDLTRKADICIGVSGDSMEPEYFDGDILLVRKQPSVDIGDIGIFIMDGNGYVKKQGEHCLISLNKEYDNIHPSENNKILCYGKVLGRLEKEWIIKK